MWCGFLQQILSQGLSVLAHSCSFSSGKTPLTQKHPSSETLFVVSSLQWIRTGIFKHPHTTPPTHDSYMLSADGTEWVIPDLSTCPPPSRFLSLFFTAKRYFFFKCFTSQLSQDKHDGTCFRKHFSGKSGLVCTEIEKERYRVSERETLNTLTHIHTEAQSALQKPHNAYYITSLITRCFCHTKMLIILICLRGQQFKFPAFCGTEKKGAC